MRRGILLVAVAVELPSRVDPQYRAMVQYEVHAFRWLAAFAGVAAAPDSIAPTSNRGSR